MNNKLQVNSIKGLLPYSSDDADFYDIDKNLIEIFFRQLNKSKFVVLSGNTGTGKTSFLNCIFDKKFSEISNVDDQWNIVNIRPGLNPVKSIPFFLSNSNFSGDKLSNGFVEEMTNLLLSDSNGLFELFDTYKIKSGTKLLLVIDPLDDLFLLSKVMKTTALITAEQQIDTFINLLCTFEKYCREFPVYVVISFSNNFPENVGRYPKFLDLIERHKFLFRGLELEGVPLLMDQILPEEIRKLKEYTSFKEKIMHDLEQEFSNTVEWLLFLQHALKMTVSRFQEVTKCGGEEDLLECYDYIGGISKSFERHADAIYNESITCTEENFKSIYGLIFRSMMGYRGQFVAMPYRDVIEGAVRIYPDQKEYLEEKYVRPFIKRMTKNELGFFEIIRSVEESDRAVVFADKTYLAGSDVICIRNKLLITRWRKLEEFQDAKVKLMYEYEWYSRLAWKHKEEGIDNFPTTVQAYALSNRNRDKSKDPEEFKVIDEIFSISESWAKPYYDKRIKGFASLEETKNYIRKAINYWIEKTFSEEKARLKKEKIKNRKVMTISGIIAAFFIVSFPFYRHMLKQLDDMKGEFDCLVTENNRIVSFIDSMQIAKLREHTQQDTVPYSVIDTLERSTNKLVRMLRAQGDSINRESYAIYGISEWKFMMNRSSWYARRDSLINKSSKIHMKVLQSVINNNVIAAINPDATRPEIFKKYKMSVMKKEDYQKLSYSKYTGVKMIECSLQKDSTMSVSPDSTYFLKCNKCK